MSHDVTDSGSREKVLIWLTKLQPFAHNLAILPAFIHWMCFYAPMQPWRLLGKTVLSGEWQVGVANKRVP